MAVSKDRIFDSDEEVLFFKVAQEKGLILQVHKKLPYINENGVRKNKTVDFYWENKSGQIKIVIECDGTQHEFQKRNDKIRDDDIRSRGIVIFRFSACAVRANPEACVQRVQDYISLQKEIISLQARARKIIYSE